MNGKKINKPVKDGKIAKVPIIMQMEATECGAASLDMVLAYYGKWIPLEQIRSDCGVSRDGSSAKNIMKAARYHGLTAQAFRMEISALKKSATFPCIAFMGFTHFVVLDGLNDKYVFINDPAKGRMKMPMSVFDEKFTGIILMFEPGENFQPGGCPPKITSFALNRLKGTGSAFAVMAIVIALVSLLQFITPGFSHGLIDRVLDGGDSQWLRVLLIMMAVVGVLQVFLGYFQEYIMVKVKGKMEVAGCAEFFWHILNLPIDFFFQRSAGDVLSRQNTYATVTTTLLQSLAPLIFQTIMMVFYLVLLLKYQALLTLVGLTAVVLNGFIATYASKKRIDIMRIYSRELASKSACLVSGMMMMSSIKSSGAEMGWFESWAGFQAAEKKAFAHAAQLNARYMALPKLLTDLANLVVLILGVLLIFDGNFTVGMLLAFQGFLTQFNTPVMSIINAGQTIQEMRVNMERIEDVMQYKGSDREVRANPVQIKDLEDMDFRMVGNVTMKDVSFGYSPLAAPILEHFDMELTPGKRVAIVGTSGCGKSTVAKLLAGLFKPWSGEVLYEGKPISEIPGTLFGSSVAMVDQTVILFEDTVRNNIKMWDNSIEDYEMILAARDVQLHEDIMRMSGGYDAIVQEKGKNLSGGQRQRMEIARALALDPCILIMDEATSALDAKTEENVMNAVKERGITCIMIAHRLSTIRDCDEIIVLDRGKVVQRGTHEELYAQEGLYAELIGSE